MAWEPQAVTKAVHANGQPVTWADLRLEYIMGNMTLRELSEKHGVSMSTLTKRSAKEGWEVARKQQAERVIEAAQQAAIDQRAKALAEFNEADLRVARALRAMVARRLNEAQEKKTNIPPKDLRALAATAVEAQRMGRLALGVSTDNLGHGGPGGVGPVPVTNVPIENYLAAREAVLREF